MFVKSTPSVLICHWTVGVGVPVATALTDADLPATNVSLASGCVLTDGATSTLKPTTLVVALAPPKPRKTASYCVPMSACAGVKVYVGDVAFGMGANFPP